MKMKSPTLFFSLLLSIVYFILIQEALSARSFGNTNDHGKLDTFKGSCPGKKALGYYDNIRFYYVNKEAIINYDIHLAQDTPAQMMVRVQIVKCNSREQPDTCQHYTTINSKHYCKMMEQQGEIWSGLFSCMEPKYTCPLKKDNVYHGKNCTIPSLTKFRFFPLGKNYWKFNVELLDLKMKTLYFCFIFEGEVA